MSTILSLARSLLRGGGRRTVLDLSLTVVGVAVPVAIMILVVGTVTGFQAREDAMAWREPTLAPDDEALALQRRTYQPWSGHRIDVVQLAALAPDPPLAPGMERFPADGEAWVSPRLADLLAERDDTEIFEDRLGTRIVGELGAEALGHSEELVAVVGDASLRPTPTGDRLGFDHRQGGGFLASDVLPIVAFADAGTDPGLPMQYMVAAWVAGVLLVAPSISLLGAGARLTAARRGRRLAALRLAGATSRQVTTLAALETAFGAVIGVGVGTVTAVAGTTVLSGIPLGGGRFAWGDLVPTAGALLVILAGSVVMAVASALAGLRGVRATPLGMVRQSTRKRPALRRILVLVLAWAGFVVTVPLTSTSGQYGLIVAGLGVVILSISMIGPLFAWVLGWLTVRLSRRARALVAGRRLMADPVGSFRPTTGLILISFVAGFLLLSSATMPEPGEGNGAFVLADPTTTVDEATESAWTRQLAVLYPDARWGRSPAGTFTLSLVPGTDLEAERARIAEVTGSVPLTEEEVGYETLLFSTDVRKATGIVVAIALIQAAFATGVGAAASVLEQAGTLAALHLAGTSMYQLRAARLLQGLIPVTVGAGLCVTLGTVAGGMTIIGIRPDATLVAPSAIQAAMVVVAAAASAVAGTALSDPVLRAVLDRPLSER